MREGFGMTALEGMAFGKPVVAYDSGGLCEAAAGCGCGDLLAPAADIGALAARVNGLLAEPGLAAATGSQARGVHRRRLRAGGLPRAPAR
ncbi:glycosyltransferase, partial [Paenibacillus sp. DMB5]|uniref:glycosyltransferase n=1 Tax=Paenibacillus sp. DMB5 TaxID=1780103 RepID=UPI0024101AC8